MNLKQVIKFLKRYSPDTKIDLGFYYAHSYRGDYEKLAFEIYEITTIKNTIYRCEDAIGMTYEGWKGGEYLMTLNSEVWLAEEGYLGIPFSIALLNYMFDETIPVNTRIEKIKSVTTFYQENFWRINYENENKLMSQIFNKSKGMKVAEGSR